MNKLHRSWAEFFVRLRASLATSGQTRYVSFQQKPAFVQKVMARKKPSLTNSSSRFSFRARDGFNGNEKQVFVRSLESGTKNSKAEYFRIETIVAKKLIAVAQNFFCFQGRSASVRNNSFLNGWKKGQYGIY